jgi:site-specific DNA-methyltransferase (adenine-specific)
MDWKNKLYFGDNLDILRRQVPDSSVDLIYLDPPFNSNATYNVLFKENVAQCPHSGPAAFQLFPAARITAFDPAGRDGSGAWRQRRYSRKSSPVARASSLT